MFRRRQISGRGHAWTAQRQSTGDVEVDDYGQHGVEAGPMGAEGWEPCLMPLRQMERIFNRWLRARLRLAARRFGRENLLLDRNDFESLPPQRSAVGVPIGDSNQPDLHSGNDHRGDHSSLGVERHDSAVARLVTSSTRDACWRSTGPRRRGGRWPQPPVRVHWQARAPGASRRRPRFMAVRHTNRATRLPRLPRGSRVRSIAHRPCGFHSRAWRGEPSRRQCRRRPGNRIRATP